MSAIRKPWMKMELSFGRKIHSISRRETGIEIQNSDQIGVDGHYVTESNELGKNDDRWRLMSDRRYQQQRRETREVWWSFSHHRFVHDSGVSNSIQQSKSRWGASNDKLQIAKPERILMNGMGWLKGQNEKSKELPMAELTPPARDRQKLDDWKQLCNSENVGYIPAGRK